jgi:hypothetical protein
MAQAAPQRIRRQVIALRFPTLDDALKYCEKWDQGGCPAAILISGKELD